MNRPLLALVTAAALSSACAGPDRTPDVGVKEVATDVVLGAQGTPAPVVPTTGPSRTPRPPFALPPPGVVALPPPPFAVSDPTRPAPPVPSPPPVPTCPVADQLGSPRLEAPSRIAGPPAARSYVFRNDGEFATSGADARTGRFPAVSSRTVNEAILGGDGGFLFDVSEVLGDTTTTTSYAVTRGTVTEPAGLYVVRVRSTRGPESSDFNPVPALPLARLPLERGGVVEARGVDPVTATTMSFTSTVTDKARVDACGTLLDSWVLTLTEGRVLSPDTDLEFESTYLLGTQYGGLVLQETTAFAGTDRGAGVTRTNTAVISSEPPATAP